MMLVKSGTYFVPPENSPVTNGNGSCNFKVLRRIVTEDGVLLKVGVTYMESPRKITTCLRSARKLCPKETKNVKNISKIKSKKEMFLVRLRKLILPIPTIGCFFLFT